MCVGLLKRFAPFAITLTIGLFVASFFVSLAAPRFEFRRYRSNQVYRDNQSLRSENENLRQQVQVLQQQLDVQPKKFEVVIPMPPPPPVAVRRAN
jgi:hypothetical protein